MIWKDFSWKEDTVLNWCEETYFGQEKFQEMNCEIRKRAREMIANYHLMLRITQCLEI